MRKVYFFLYFIPLVLLLTGSRTKGDILPLEKEGWKSAVVDDGVIYSRFEGVDQVSGAPQIVHVTDIDLSKGYKLKFHYSPDMEYTSDFFRKYSPVAVINGGYEPESIFIKVDGVEYHNISNRKVMKSDVPNWKNDGGICIDSKDSIFICNSIFSKDGDGQSEYGASLDRQMTYYRDSLDCIPNVISSAPLLICDGVPTGASFVPDGDISGFHYEHPFRHQGSRHPRTAVALTHDRHLLFIVADGRREGRCSGFTSKELTEFLIRYFNPEYALNLDGGGSSTMCVKDCGDPGINVVNYPCDGSTENVHTNQRLITTFLYVVK